MQSRGHGFATTQRGLARSQVITALLVLAGAAFLVMGVFKKGHREAAFDALTRGDYVTAEARFDALVTSNPKDPEAIYYRGYARQQLGQTRLALEDYATLHARPRWQELAVYRTIETLLEDERASQAQAEIDSLPQDLLKNALIQEAVGRYHYWECERGIERSHKLLAPTIGDRPADRMRSFVRRVALADSKVYAASLDRLSERLQNDYEFKKSALLGTIIDRAHSHLLQAHRAFSDAARLSEQDASQPAVILAHRTLADIYAVRRRMNLADRHLRAIIDTDRESMGGDVPMQEELAAWRQQAIRRLAESRLKARAYDEAISLVEKVKPGSKGHRPYEFERILAEAHLGMGHEEKALELARYWLKQQPKLPTPNFILGRWYYQQGQFDKAFPFLEIAVGRRYTSRQFVEPYVACLLKLGKFDRANGVLDQVLKARPTDWKALLLKVQAMEGMGWIEDARALLNRSLGTRFTKPGSEANTALRRFMEEFIDRNDLLPKDLHTAQVLYREDKDNFDIGRRYLDLLVEAGAVENAHSLARDLFKRCPKDDMARYHVALSAARAFEAIGRHREAMAAYEEAIQLHPFEVDAHVGLARTFIHLKDVEAASRALDHAAALAPDLPELHRLRFQIFAAEGRNSEALKEAEQWIARGGRDQATLFQMASFYLDQGDTRNARKALTLLESLNVRERDDRTRLALLHLRAGDNKKAVALLDRITTGVGFGISHLIRLGSDLNAAGRPDLVIKYLLNPVLEDREIDSAAVLILARAYRDNEDTERYLDLLSRLRRRGRVPESYTWTVAFCADLGALKEVLSIADAAVSLQLASPALLETAIKTALKTSRRKLADRFMGELIRLNPDIPGLKERMTALLLRQDGKVVEAGELLKKTLTRIPARERAPVWTQLIEMLAETGQLQAMKKATAEAIVRREVPASYAARAARLLIAAADPQAAQAVTSAIQVAPDSADAWFDAGMAALAADDLEGALRSLTRSWELRPDQSSTHALAMLAAVMDRRALLRKVLRKKDGRYPSQVPPETPDMALMVQHLSRGRVKEALPLAGRLSYPSVAERMALQNLIRTPLSGKDLQRDFARQLTRFFVFAANDHTLRFAAQVAGKLEELKPQRRREIDLMRARALMGSDLTFLDGIRIVSRILSDSDMSDEAALTIYAQSYIRSGQVDDLRRLVDFILPRDNFGSQFKMDLARILTKAGLSQDAARLLHTCTDDSLEKTRQEAMALFKSGHLDRAAELVKSRIPKDRRGFHYCYIVGCHESAGDQPNAEGYELLRRAIYRFGALDDDVQLAFAREAYRRGELEEARKSIRQYLKKNLASARRVNEALKLVQNLDQPDPAFNTVLEDRRFLLDPSGYLDAK